MTPYRSQSQTQEEQEQQESTATFEATSPRALQGIYDRVANIQFGLIQNLRTELSAFVDDSDKEEDLEDLEDLDMVTPLRVAATSAEARNESADSGRATAVDVGPGSSLVSDTNETFAKQKEYTREQWQDRLNEIQIPRDVLNKLIMNYLINEGYQASAIKFAKEAGVSAPVDLSLIKDRMRIKSLINAGQIKAAIEMVNDIEPMLLDTAPSLHFALLRLQLIELIRESYSSEGQSIDKLQPALEFASTHLAQRAPANPQFLADLEMTMALLCFPPDRLLPELQALLDVKMRQTIANKVNEALLELQGINSTSQIHNLIKLWSWGEKSLADQFVYFPALNTEDIY